MNAATAARYQEALSRARSRLAAADAVALTGGDQQGDDGGGYRWRLRVTPVSTGTAAGATPVPALFGVSVTISWQADRRVRSVQLDTRRLGPAAPRAP